MPSDCKEDKGGPSNPQAAPSPRAELKTWEIDVSLWDGLSLAFVDLGRGTIEIDVTERVLGRTTRKTLRTSESLCRDIAKMFERFLGEPEKPSEEWERAAVSAAEERKTCEKGGHDDFERLANRALDVTMARAEKACDAMEGPDREKGGGK